jgi:hypothetical protein
MVNFLNMQACHIIHTVAAVRLVVLLKSCALNLLILHPFASGQADRPTFSIRPNPRLLAHLPHSEGDLATTIYDRAESPRCLSHTPLNLPPPPLLF